MKLGFATPVSLQLLRPLVEGGEHLPPGYQFAASADWVRELMKRGHHVTLYTTAREIDAPKSFHGDGITIRIARQRSAGTGQDFFAAERRQLKQMMSEDQCQLIHAHWTYQFALAALASKIPVLITVHDLPWNVLLHFRDMHRAARLLMAYGVAMRGKHFTAVSSDAASHFQRFFKPGAGIAVIPNGLPYEFFKMPPKAMGTSGETIVFATVLQGWSRQKNAKAALKAFGIVRREVPGARLLMFGVNYEPGGVAHRWAGDLSLDDGVTFVGLVPYRDLINRLRDEVDVVVHPSLDESFSMTALEAMALKKPVIAGIETTGVREVLGFGRSGILVDVRNPSAIADEMIRLAHDTSYREIVAQSGFDRAFSQYRLDSVIGQYESLYSKILQSERNCGILTAKCIDSN
jgi:glycosyltransferase involved in cell wall biosynthesis